MWCTGLQPHMHRYFFFLLLASLASANTVGVEVRENEVWLIRNGQPAHLTRDGRTRLEAVLSMLVIASPIHSFVPPFSWSPESNRGTLFDCVF